MTHLKQATQQFSAIPKDRLRSKIGRTVGGVLIVAVAAVLRKFNLLPEREATIGMVVGGLTASYEIVQAPLRFGVAIIRDVKAALVNGKKPDQSEDVAP